MGQSLNEAANL